MKIKIKSPIDFGFAICFAVLSAILIGGALTGRLYCLIEVAFIAPLSVLLFRESTKKEKKDVRSM